MLGSSQLLSTYFAIEWGLLLQREEAPSVFSAYCSQLLFHASPPSSCFAWGRKTLWKFLAASSFFSPSLLPSLLVTIKNIVNLSHLFHSPSPTPSKCLCSIAFPYQKHHVEYSNKTKGTQVIEYWKASSWTTLLEENLQHNQKPSSLMMRLQHWLSDACSLHH